MDATAMEGAQPPLMVSSGFLPAATLLESLILVSDDVASIEKAPFLQRKNISAMMRRISLLSSLFEEIQEQVQKQPLPPSSVLCLTELYSVIRRAKILIESSVQGSLLWNLMQTESISNQFYTLVKEMARALDILPLSLLDLSADTKEQVELLHKQATRAQLYVDHVEAETRDHLIRAAVANNEGSRKSKGFVDLVRVRDSLRSMGVNSPEQIAQEVSKLEAEAEKQAGTGGLVVVSNINSLISLISMSKTSVEENSRAHVDLKKRKVPTSNRQDQSFSSFMAVSVPDEFRCPISLDLMNDPVIVASGHTYDRSSIAQWINSGHHTCPKSGQRLIHMALIPNYALRSLIQQWCQENMIPTAASEVERSSSKRRSSETAVDHISVTKAAADAVKMTAEFLVGKLATGSRDIQRQAAYELRLLAKTGMDNRSIIAEAGAIPFLVTLLGSPDSRIQENAVTALLNLSIHENNKMLIMAAGAIDSIVEVLQSGNTMEAKENAAATIFSLSIIGEHKAIIGAHPRVIPALVRLLGEGTAAGKRDAATALFNLALFNANRGKVSQMML
ncbi:U-box domain-containing protein 1-like isoform X2 [Salvia hispanica]|uniref:U-box domain-containing protein 1-like isoform X2 n=1 Tax=Salvia hispanica TaxID=49212 RepID=UPI002008FBA2|nr:U-box domain-containing protein 1-like isoform X2 [Salvia hispanica]